MSIVSILNKEGSTALAVPSLSEPKMIPAFFNPRARFVRDISIICYNSYCKEKFSSKRTSLTFADSLAGTGARGIRVANEVPEIDRVFLNDINSKALEFAKKSAKINMLEDKCIFSRSEVSSFLASRIQNDGERFDFVDVDPFGTPSDYIECAIRAVKDGGLLSLTATDSAVLCGVYPRVALRKYLGFSLRTEYCDEVGMRLLFGLASQIAMRLETGIEPIFCHHDMHYFRVYLSVKVGNSFSRQNEKNVGFILHCFGCRHRSIIARDEFFSLSKPEIPRQKEVDSERGSLSGSRHLICSNCGRGGSERGGRIAIAGPLWIGSIQSSPFVLKCKEISQENLFSEEIDLPLYYDLTAIRLKKGSSLPKITSVLEKLRSLGYLASRTRLNPNALRTDASMEVLQQSVLELAR
jgi:tRNA (guanine26-N2/guanine27-N2)-dimethyltransferase